VASPSTLKTSHGPTFFQSHSFPSQEIIGRTTLPLVSKLGQERTLNNSALPQQIIRHKARVPFLFPTIGTSLRRYLWANNLDGRIANPVFSQTYPEIPDPPI
jgi:hypothetical protein